MRVVVVAVVATVDFIGDDGRSESKQYRLDPADLGLTLQVKIDADLKEMGVSARPKSRKGQ
jgi:hypothetical protein